MDNYSVDDIVRLIEFGNYLETGEYRLRIKESFFILINFSVGKEAPSEKTHDHTS